MFSALSLSRLLLYIIAIAFECASSYCLYIVLVKHVNNECEFI